MIRKRIYSISSIYICWAFFFIFYERFYGWYLTTVLKTVVILIACALLFQEGCILPPSVPEGVLAVRHTEIWPTECRQSASTYKGRLIVRVSWTLNGAKQLSIERDLGSIPIMIKVFFLINTIKIVNDLWILNGSKTVMKQTS